VTGALRVSTAVAVAGDGRTAVAAVFRWDEDDDPRIVVRRLRRQDPVPPGYRALLVALWDARRLRARTVEVCIDDADVAAQIAGTTPPPAAAIGPYLQVRALTHAFRSAEVRWVEREQNEEAVAAAAAALDPRQPIYADLPLWRAAS
jgi:ribonuclease HI